MGEDSGFNSGEVADDEFVSGTGYEGGADQFGYGIYRNGDKERTGLILTGRASALPILMIGGK